MITMLQGDCRDLLPTLAPESVQCAVTSPPYYALRDYGTATWDGGDPECDHIEQVQNLNKGFNERWGNAPGERKQERTRVQAYRAICGKCGALRRDNQIGLEAQPDCLAWARQEPPCGACYVCALRHVFALLWPVLRADGVAWLNLGDSYASSGGARTYGSFDSATGRGRGIASRPAGLADKNLLGIPWRVALALQADGWILRSDVVWSKPNCMPESVKDRPTRAHEYVFLLAKQGRYYFDSEAIAEAAQEHSASAASFKRDGNKRSEALVPGNTATHRADRPDVLYSGGTRNARTVWTISTKPFSGAHFAVFPEDLAERCIRAGSRPGDTVLDPFGGSGTVARVAERLGRSATLIELSPEYIGLQEKRINGVQIELPLIAEGFHGD